MLYMPSNLDEIRSKYNNNPHNDPFFLVLEIIIYTYVSMQNNSEEYIVNINDRKDSRHLTFQIG